jgi:dethiobiotin synthetase
MGSIIFITGTGTGVGKTLLTALLVRWLRERQCHAMAMKPFCSGSRNDVDLLWDAQERALPKAQINPFYFRQPVAPLVACRSSGKTIPLAAVVQKVRSVARQCEVLLVEGAGGLLVPLGERYTVAELIQRLGCPVLCVAQNRLGTVNHTLLTVGKLRAVGVETLGVVLMNGAQRDPSCRSNAQLIQQFTGRPVVGIPFLGADPAKIQNLVRLTKRFKKTLAQIPGTDTFSSSFGSPAAKKVKKNTCGTEENG